MDTKRKEKKYQKKKRKVVIVIVVLYILVIHITCPTDRVHYKDIKNEFCQLVIEAPTVFLNLLDNKKAREVIVRKAENITRKKMGLKNVGDAYVNEPLLANFTKKIFPDAIRQYRANWLDKFILDIYVPSMNFAIEYHGVQHFKPIDRFGGTEKLLRQQNRDEFVRNKCWQRHVLLIEWHFTEKVTEKSVFEKYSNYFEIDYNKSSSAL
ncbi:MAG: hypothetical protein ABIP95_02635 [Pelobium sp.]